MQVVSKTKHSRPTQQSIGILLCVGLAGLLSEGRPTLLMAIILSALISLVLISEIVSRQSANAVTLEVRYPVEAQVGEPVAIYAKFSGRRGFATINYPVEQAIPIPFSGLIQLAPERRGVYEETIWRIELHDPWGLNINAVEWRIRLDSMLYVGPNPIWPNDPEILKLSTSVNATRDFEIATNYVREYRNGDLPKLVHWPTSARHNDIFVREVEGQNSYSLIVVADLSRNNDDGEQIASRASGICQTALGQGIEVRLIVGAKGRITSQVLSSKFDLIRTLAIADNTPIPETDELRGALWV